ncbi:hypothetical protein NLG97_g4177 [Lecanicillium saksenae]|uniref:Uncharacterized protein n=1 Tax=Lecanicillium saksenae TaxID=468837 RepID=A0ACC1QW81_9HYPO|nr:hypothetical protein NLG97_g4177 [Lecanicillium saksenae]
MWAIIAIAVTAALFCRFILYPIYFSPLSNIPIINPLAAVTSLWIQWHRWRGTEFQLITRGFATKGPYLRVGPNEIILNDIEAVQNVYGVGSNNFDKHPSYDYFITQGDEKSRWLWIDQFNMSYPPDSGFWMKEYPMLIKWLPRLGIPLVPQGHFQARKACEKWAIAKVEECEAVLQDAGGDLQSATSLPPGELPILYSYVRESFAKLSESPKIFRPKHDEVLELASECFDHISATGDTFGTMFTYMVYELSRHPAIQRDLRQELLTIQVPFVFDCNSSASLEIPSPQSLEHLPFLDCVIKESLRLRNNAPNLDPRLTSAHGVSKVGALSNLPPGVRIGTYGWCLNRNADVYPNPDSWEPRRWQSGGSEAAALRQAWLFAFGGGSRGCIGQQAAMELMRLLLCGIYTNFSTSIADESEYPDNMITKVLLGLLFAGLWATTSALPSLQSARTGVPIKDRYLHHHRSNNTLTEFKAGQFSLAPANETVCATYGESQWTGTIDVSDSRRLFFWAFNSRNDPANDPVIIWLNGGPAGSSMLGLFAEMGPCSLNTDSNATIPNPWAWNNNATLVFIDQPAGVGFSSVADNSPLPKTNLDGAEDFQTFLNIFFRDVFPDKAHLPIHIATESYGGRYGPVYTKHILESRRYGAQGAFWGNISSLVLVNAVLDQTAPALGAYELLCVQSRGKGILNDTSCESMRAHMPQCEALGQSCQLTQDGYICEAMIDYCFDNIHSHFAQLVETGTRSSFNIHNPCYDMPLCSDPTKGNITAYLNQPHIKDALGLPMSFTYASLNSTINKLYIDNRDPWCPTTNELAAVLDAYLAAPVAGPSKQTLVAQTDGLGDIKVLVLNGNEDYAVNTPGQKWLYESLRWSGQADYRAAQWQSLESVNPSLQAGGQWKSSRDARLVFVAVDGAGHMVPGDVGEGSYRILQRWLEGGWRMLR